MDDKLWRNDVQKGTGYEGAKFIKFYSLRVIIILVKIYFFQDSAVPNAFRGTINEPNLVVKR